MISSKQIIKRIVFIVAFSLSASACFSDQVKESNMQSKLFNKQWNIQSLNQNTTTE
jgi:hypothetical protein